MIAVTDMALAATFIGCVVSLVVQTLFLGRWVGRTTQRMDNNVSRLDGMHASIVRERETDAVAVSDLHKRLDTINESVSACREEIGKVGGRVEVLLQKAGEGQRP